MVTGICLLILFFCSYLTALSWADLTYVLPATALSYIFMVLLARVFLHETCHTGALVGDWADHTGSWFCGYRAFFNGGYATPSRGEI